MGQMAGWFWNQLNARVNNSPVILKTQSFNARNLFWVLTNLHLHVRISNVKLEKVKGLVVFSSQGCQDLVKRGLGRRGKVCITYI
jgi:hypothetical protein